MQLYKKLLDVIIFLRKFLITTMLPHPDRDGSDDYQDRQAAHDGEYVRAWESAPPEFKAAAAKAGLIMEPENRNSETLQYNENHVESSYRPDMAAALDDYIDDLIEKHGPQHAIFIRSIAEELKVPMEHELLLHRSELLGRIAGYLICDERGNMLARTHALLHSIPLLARCSGQFSIRSSARQCKVSPEWLRRARDRWCILLGISPPAEGVKSDEAKKKYKANALSNHWRSQKFHAVINTNGEHK